MDVINFMYIYVLQKNKENNHRLIKIRVNIK